MKIRNTSIPSAGPWITKDEIDLVSKAIREGWGKKMNMHIEKFIEEFSDFTQLKYCLPTAHCTDAIHLALVVSDIGPGDEVIVPDLTWVASVAPIEYVGATPVFVDVNSTNLCIDPDSFERAITKRTKAVIGVDLLGNMVDWKKINKIAKKHNLIVIEDAAESLGAVHRGKPAGNFGDISLFSFSGTKLITSQQGGIFATNDEELYQKAKMVSHHGINKHPGHEYFWSTTLGYNYNWTNIQAALALAQLRRIDELLEYKIWLYNIYKSELKGIKGLKLNEKIYKNTSQSFWITYAIVSPKYGLSKQKLVENFQKYNIETRPMFYPVSSMPPFAKYIHNQEGKAGHEINPNAYRISDHSVCLPNGFNMSQEDVKYICDAFKEILKKNSY